MASGPPLTSPHIFPECGKEGNGVMVVDPSTADDVDGFCDFFDKAGENADVLGERITALRLVEAEDCGAADCCVGTAEGEMFCMSLLLLPLRGIIHQKI